MPHQILSMEKYNKRQLWLLLIKRLNHFVHNGHILSVINIFFDELVKEILAGNEIRIINFGTFSIKDLKGKRFRDIVSQKIALSKSTKALRFKVSRNLSKYLSDRYYEQMKNSVMQCKKE